MRLAWVWLRRHRLHVAFIHVQISQFSSASSAYPTPCFIFFCCCSFLRISITSLSSFFPSSSIPFLALISRWSFARSLLTLPRPLIDTVTVYHAQRPAAPWPVNTDTDSPLVAPPARPAKPVPPSTTSSDRDPNQSTVQMGAVPTSISSTALSSAIVSTGSMRLPPSDTPPSRPDKPGSGGPPLKPRRGYSEALDPSEDVVVASTAPPSEPPPVRPGAPGPPLPAKVRTNAGVQGFAEQVAAVAASKKGSGRVVVEDDIDQPAADLSHASEQQREEEDRFEAEAEPSVEPLSLSALKTLRQQRLQRHITVGTAGEVSAPIYVLASARRTNDEEIDAEAIVQGRAVRPGKGEPVYMLAKDATHSRRHPESSKRDTPGTVTVLDAPAYPSVLTTSSQSDAVNYPPVRSSSPPMAQVCCL